MFDDSLAGSLRIVLAILSSYRIAQLFVYDEGPYGIFESLRVYLGKKSSKNESWRNMALLINCPYCMGIWSSIFCALLIFFPTVIGDIILLIFGIAGGQAFLQARSYNDEH